MRSVARDSALPLAARIDSLEKGLLERRRRISTGARGIGPKIRARITSPGMLLAAVGLGVVLQRAGRQHGGWSVMTVLNAVSTVSTLLMNAMSSPNQPQASTNETRTRL